MAGYVFLAGIADHAEVRDVLVDLVLEGPLGHAQRDGEDAHEVCREALHLGKVFLPDLAHPLGRVGPRVRREVMRARGSKVIVVVRVSEGPHAERLFKVWRRFLIEAEGESLATHGRVPAVAVRRHLEAHLLRQRKGEVLFAHLVHVGDQVLGNAVSLDHQKPDVPASIVQLPGNGLLFLGPAVKKRADID